jgi:hypothetical protein
MVLLLKFWAYGWLLRLKTAVKRPAFYPGRAGSVFDKTGYTVSQKYAIYS